MSKKKIYGLITAIFVIISIVLLCIVDRTNSINLSLVIEVIIILYLCRIMYGCILYIKEQYNKQKYSYKIIMNLGLIVFLFVNILRLTNLLIFNFGETSIDNIYSNTIESFSYFAVLILPFIAFLGVYSIITNLILIKKEGFSFQNILGIIFTIIIIFGALSGQTVYMFTQKLTLSAELSVIKIFIDLSINSIVTYFYCIVVATLYCNVIAGNHNPKYDKDFVIILGSQIRKDGTLPPLLKARVDRALKFYKDQKENVGKDIIFVTSGGQGKDENIPEGVAIKNYLVEQGIKEENIVIEDKSTTTKENLKFSKDKIDEVKKDGKIAFSTTNYHVFRSGVIANNQGIDCEGMGSKTKMYFYVNALIREFFANLITEKNKHLALIAIMNISLLTLVLIGYFCGFIK